MATKKYIIHCLLVLCIVLQPALSAIEINPEHSASAPMHGFDCDPAEVDLDDTCADTDCNPVTHSCGFNAGANYLPASSLAENIPIAQKVDLNLNEPDYRQNITDPIYRPPIA